MNKICSILSKEKLLVILFAAALVAISLLGREAFALPMGGKGRGPLIGVFFSDELHLTAEQRQKIGDIIVQHKDAIKADFKALGEGHHAFRAYLKSGGSEPAEVAQLASAHAAALQKLEIDEATIFSAAYGVLTSDQKSILSTLPEPQFHGRFGKSGASDSPQALRKFE